MDGTGQGNPRGNGCFGIINFFRRCKWCKNDEPDDEAHFRYKGSKVPNTAGIYMCPRNIDNLPDAPGPSVAAPSLAEKAREEISGKLKSCLKKGDDKSPRPTRDELLKKAVRMGVPSHNALPHSCVQFHRDSVELVHMQRGQRRRKLTRSRAMILTQIREEKEDKELRNANAADSRV